MTQLEFETAERNLSEQLQLLARKSKEGGVTIWC